MSQPEVDFATSVVFETFDEFMAAATEEVEGVRLWRPARIVTAPGHLGCDLSLDRLLQVYLECVEHTSGDDPPSLTVVAISAASAGGQGDDILLRSQRALLQSTVEFLWACAERRGLTLASGFVVLPTARSGAQPGPQQQAGRKPPPPPSAAPSPTPSEASSIGRGAKRNKASRCWPRTNDLLHALHSREQDGFRGEQEGFRGCQGSHDPTL